VTIAFPQQALHNLPSARCLYDVCEDRTGASMKATLTPWEIWFVPESSFALGELTIAVAAPTKPIMPLFATDRRIMLHREQGGYRRNPPLVHREWSWDQLADVESTGWTGIRLSWRDGSRTVVRDRKRSAAKTVVARMRRALDVHRAGGSLRENWQTITGMTPQSRDPRMEALEFLHARDTSSVEGNRWHIMKVLERDEVPLSAQQWNRGLTLNSSGTDELLAEGTRIWVMTDRRLLELQGDSSFRVRRQWDARDILGARPRDRQRRTPDTLVTTAGEIPFPSAPSVEEPTMSDIRAVAAINEAVEAIRRG
jgi:hypothetical protein